MTKRDREKLWNNPDIQTYIRGQARRHFSDCTEREIAESLAWARIEMMSNYPTRDQIKHAAYNAIHAYWKRRYRERVALSKIPMST